MELERPAPASGSTLQLENVQWRTCGRGPASIVGTGRK